MERVLVFSRTWSLDRASGELDTIRQRVAELGLQLVVVTRAGVFVFDPDGGVDRVDRIAGDVRTAAVIYRVGKSDAAFLVSDDTALRVACDGSLLDALEGAAALRYQHAEIAA